MLEVPIEWQKRGLPHVHYLFWLANKMRPGQIDDIISAEIPNPEGDPLLFQIVTKQLLHGPCGSFNPRSPCMENGKCQKNTRNFSHKILRQTTMDIRSTYIANWVMEALKLISKYEGNMSSSTIYGLFPIIPTSQGLTTHTSMWKSATR